MLGFIQTVTSSSKDLICTDIPMVQATVVSLTNLLQHLFLDLHSGHSIYFTSNVHLLVCILTFKFPRMEQFSKKKDAV